MTADNERTVMMEEALRLALKEAHRWKEAYDTLKASTFAERYAARPGALMAGLQSGEAIRTRNLPFSAIECASIAQQMAAFNPRKPKPAPRKSRRPRRAK